MKPENDAIRVTPPLRLLRRVLIFAVCFAVAVAGIIALIYLVEDFRGERAWAAAEREVREHGGTTDYAAIIPAPVPDDQNLAMAPLFAKALDYHVDPVTRQLTFGHPRKEQGFNGMPFSEQPPGGTLPKSGGGWQQGHALDLAAWQQYYRADSAFPRTPDPRWPAVDVLLALSRYSGTLKELSQAAASRPRSRFPINWTNPSVYMISLPQGNFLLQLAQALRLRACAELADGNPAAALADITLILRLSDALQYDSMLIDHLVNITILNGSAQPIWDGLAAHSWRAPELAQLQALLLKKDVLQDCAHAIRSEEASIARGIDYLEQHGDSKDILRIFDENESADLSFHDRLFYWFIGVAPRGWYDQNKARLVSYDQTYLLAAVDPSSHRVFPAKIAAGIIARSEVPVGAYTLFFRLQAPTFDTILPRSARTQVICDQAAIACALERFFLDHKTYPDGLNALVPTYLQRMPTDVIDGAPMRYQRTPDGRYLLYSIGWNNRDDGGQVAWKKEGGLNFNKGDWVWQYQPLQPPADSIH